MFRTTISDVLESWQIFAAPKKGVLTTLSVDCVKPEMNLNGLTHVLSRTDAFVLDGLLRARGGVMCNNDLKALHPELEYEGDGRLGRTVASLQKRFTPLRTRIEHVGKRGWRLVLDGK